MSKKKSKKGKEPTVDTRLLEREGEKFFQAGNYAGAITTWNRLLKMRGGENAPINKNLLLHLSRAYLKLSHSLSGPEKIQHLLNACVYDPDALDLNLDFLKICKETGNFDVYLDFCEQMIQKNRNKSFFEKMRYLLSIDFQESIKKGKDREDIKKLPSPFVGEEKKIYDALVLFKSDLPIKGIHLLDEIEGSDHISFLKGLFYLQVQLKEKAIPIFNQILQGPSSIFRLFAKYYLLALYIQTGNFDPIEPILQSLEEEKELYEYLLSKPRKKLIANILSALAYQRAKQSQFEKAAELWQEALDFNPRDESISHNLQKVGVILAASYAKEGHIEKAVAFWGNIFKKEKRNPIISKNLAIACQLTQKFEEASVYWRHTIDLWESRPEKNNPEMVSDLSKAYQHLGMCCTKMGRLDETRESYEQVIRLDPKNWHIKTKLVDYYLEEENTEEALSLIEELIKAEPENSLHLYNRGVIEEMRGKIEKAYKWWEKALALNPRDGNTLKVLCESYFLNAYDYYALKKFKSALSLVEKLLQQKPDDAKALCLKGAIYLRQKKETLANEMFQAAIEAKPDSPEIFIMIGDKFLDAGRMEEAEGYFLRAHQKINPQFPLQDVLFKRGLCYLDRKETEEKSHDFFLQAIEAGGYEMGLRVLHTLLHISRPPRFMEIAEIVHRKNPKDAVSLEMMMEYAMKTMDVSLISKIVTFAQNSPDYRNNIEMKRLVQDLHYFLDMLGNFRYGPRP